MNTHQDSLMSASELADYLGISRATIYRLRSEGKDDQLPPCVHVGTHPRWRMSTVDAWLEEQEQKNAA